jgi:hypothetical protein
MSSILDYHSEGLVFVSNITQCDTVNICPYASLEVVFFDIRYTVLMFADIISSKVIKWNFIFYLSIVSCLSV